RGVLAAAVEPKAAPCLVGSARVVETRLVDEPEIAPAIGARIAEARMRADDLEQIERAEGVVGHAGPEAVVAAAPDDPHVAAGDLGRIELDRAVHVVEVIVGGVLERRAVAAGQLGFVENGARLWPLGAARE